MASYEEIRNATGHTGTTGLRNYPVAPPPVQDIVLGPDGHIRTATQNGQDDAPITVLPHEVMAAPPCRPAGASGWVRETTLADPGPTTMTHDTGMPDGPIADQETADALTGVTLGKDRP